MRIDGLDCLGRARDDVNRRVLGTPCAQDTDIVLGFKRAGQDSYEVILRRTFQKATAAPQIVEDTSEREDKEGSKKKYRFAGLSPVQREIMRRVGIGSEGCLCSSSRQGVSNALPTAMG